MLQIPLDLPAQFIPLAWLLGQWRGWGTVELLPIGQAGIAEASSGVAPGYRTEQDQPGKPPIPNEYPNYATTEEPRQLYILQESEFSIEGEELWQTTCTWRASASKTPPDLTADAATGWNSLRRNSLLWQERLRWQINRFVPAGKEQDQPTSNCTIRVEGGPHPDQSDWQADSLGPRIICQAEVPGNSAIRQLTRMFGLVNGELFWAQDARLDPNPDFAGGGTGAAEPPPSSISDFSARMARYANN